jgi:thiol:disulfide interchange protein DsbD
MGSPWLGFIVFFTLSIGLGLPLFILALFSGQLQRLLRSGGWMLWVRKLMGWVLVGMAAYFLKPILREPGTTIAVSAVFLAAGVHLAWLDRNKATFEAFLWLKTTAGAASFGLAVFLIVSFLMRGPGVAWADYSDDVIKEAAPLKRPVVIDFYAAWCAPCRELDETTFHDPAVVKKASDFVMIKVDVTKSGNSTHERLLQEYGIKGVPTVIFLNADGRECQDLRLLDFLPPDQMLNHMSRLHRECS